MLSRVMSALRCLAVGLAMLGVLGQGSQTHLAFAEGETITVLICGQGGSRTVEMTLGGDGPPEDTNPGGCDDCTPAPGALSLKAQTAVGSNILPVRVLRSREGDPVHPGGPLWPGAPPNGPPVFA